MAPSVLRPRRRKRLPGHGPHCRNERAVGQTCGAVSRPASRQRRYVFCHSSDVIESAASASAFAESVFRLARLVSIQFWVRA